MKKPLFFAVAALLLFTTCKKSKNVVPVIDATGKWTLYSWKSDIPTNIDVTSDEYPCMSENVLTFNKDYTFTSAFIGKDTCYVSKDLNNNNMGTLQGTEIGIAGQAAVSGNWHQNGNDLYFGSYRGTMSNSNGKTFLAIYDTINYNNVNHIITTVDIKQ